MRSRYSAFALRDAAHLRETWHPSTRPARVELDGGLTWVSLAVDETREGRPGDRRGVVAFRAQWRDGRTGERGTLQERSRFVFQRDRWWYADGDVTA
jgi:SEC-C motif-containing protein